MTEIRELSCCKSTYPFDFQRTEWKLRVRKGMLPLCARATRFAFRTCKRGRINWHGRVRALNIESLVGSEHRVLRAAQRFCWRKYASQTMVSVPETSTQNSFDVNSLRELRPEQITEVLSNCKGSQDLEKAREIYSFTLRFLALSRDFFVAMMDIYIQEELFDDAVVVFAEMDAEGFEADIDIMNKLLVAFGKAKMVSRIDEIMEAISVRRLVPNEQTYDTVVRAYIADNQSLKAEEYFYKMLRNHTPSMELFELVLHDFVRHRRLEEAYGVLRSLSNRDMKPALALYNTIINACASHRNHSLAWKCFNEIKLRTDIKPDVDSWNLLIKCFSRSEKFDLAQKCMREMTKPQTGVAPDAVTYGLIIRGLTTLKKPLEVEQLFLEMRSKGLVADSVTWRYVIESFARTNQLDKAFILIDQMTQEGVKIHPVLRNILLRCCQRTNKMNLFTERFGPVRERNEVVKLGAFKFLEQLQKEVEHDELNLDWEEGSSAFSIVNEAKKRREKQEEMHDQHMMELEEEFLRSLPPKQREEMRENQRKLTEEIRRNRRLPPSPAAKVKKSKEAKFLEKKKKKAAQMYKGKKPPQDPTMPHTKGKRKTTFKDTRRPRAQFAFNGKWIG